MLCIKYLKYLFWDLLLIYKPIFLYLPEEFFLWILFLIYLIGLNKNIILLNLSCFLNCLKA